MGWTKVLCLCLLQIQFKSSDAVVSDVKPNNTLGEFATWGPEWSITFDMELKSAADNDQWYNLFQFTANDKHCCDAGDRVPGILAPATHLILLIFKEPELGTLNP